MIIRGCVGGYGDLSSQCGEFWWRDEKMKGCILTCQDDFCNTAEPLIPPVISTIILVLLQREILELSNMFSQ